MANGYYDSGTATVELDGIEVAGIGTAWASQVRAGDKFTRDGFSVPIQAVNSNTSLTLAWGFPKDLTGTTYKIELLPDLTRALEAMENLAALLGGGNLQSFGSLALSANKLPYATGVGTLALTDLTSVARQLLDDANFAAMRDTLLVPTRGIVGLDQLFTEAAPIAAAPITDLGAATGAYVVVSGSATITSFGTATPGSTRTIVFSGGNAILVHSGNIVLPGNANLAVTSGDVAMFVAIGAGAWRCTNFLRRSDVPAGAPSYGSNANGSWVRFHGGFQVCMRDWTDSATPPSAFGNIWLGDSLTWTFPAAFAAAPYAGGMFRGTGSRKWVTGGGAAASGTQMTIQTVAGIGSGAAANAAGLYAFGMAA